MRKPRITHWSGQYWQIEYPDGGKVSISGWRHAMNHLEAEYKQARHIMTLGMLTFPPPRVVTPVMEPDGLPPFRAVWTT